MSDMTLHKLHQPYQRLTGTLLMVSVLVACSTGPKMEELRPIPKGVVPQKIWSTTSAGESAGAVMVPAVVGADIYVAGTDGVVRRLATPGADGASWRRKLHPLLGGVASDGRLVVVTGLKGQITALDAKDGKTVWEVTRPTEITAPAAVLDQVVVLKNNDGVLLGLSRDTAQVVWQYRYTPPSLTVHSFAKVAVLEGGRLIVGLPGGQLVALDANTGERQWQAEVSPRYGTTELEQLNDVVGDLALDEKHEIVCAATFRGRLGCFQVTGGTLIWAKEFSSPVGVAIDGNALYAVDPHGSIYAFRLSNGSKIWQQDGLANREPTTPVLWSPYLVVGDQVGYLHLLNPKDGQFVGRVRQDVGNINAIPVGIAKNRLAVLSKYGRLSIFAHP